MKKFATGLALICAIALLAGIFLPWIHYQSGSIGGFSISYSLSGWGVFHNTSWFDNIVLSALKLDSNTHALIVFIASIVMLLCSLAAVVAIAGLIWFAVDMSSADNWSSDNNWSDYIGTGFYVCGGGAVLGLVGGILASVKGK
jgi:hypothetical protein